MDKKSNDELLYVGEITEEFKADSDPHWMACEEIKFLIYLSIRGLFALGILMLGSVIKVGGRDKFSRR